MSALNTNVEATSASPVSSVQILYWAIRRELWEYRSIYIAPAIVAGIAILGYAFATTGRAISTRDMSLRLSMLAEPYDFASGVIVISAILVQLFYCLDALYGERRDRSILFWKSLPVSDLTTVLSKVAIPLIVIPAVAVAITAAAELMMLTLGTLVALGSGLSVATLWDKVSLFQNLSMLVYHLATVHVLWYAPIYGWLILASGWARRVPLLWATVPVLAVGAVEWITFHTWTFANLVKYRFTGGAEAIAAPGGSSMSMYSQVTPGRFLSEPGLWLGLIAAALLLAAAVRLRRSQGPI